VEVFPTEQKVFRFEMKQNVSRRLRSIGAIKSDKKKPSSATVDLASQIFPGNFKV